MRKGRWSTKSQEKPKELEIGNTHVLSPLKRGAFHTLTSCWSGFWACKAEAQTLAPEPWWMLQSEGYSGTLLEAHQHLLSPLTHILIVPLFYIAWGWPSFWYHNSLYLFSSGESCLLCKKKCFSGYQVCVCCYYFFLIYCVDQYNHIPLVATPLFCPRYHCCSLVTKSCLTLLRPHGL